jgi:magnesium-transporting ATPase (P-type)
MGRPLVTTPRTVRGKPVPGKMPETWHDLDVDQVFAELGSSRAGLGSADALMRLALFGRNVLPSRKQVGRIELIWRHIQNPLAIVLTASGFVALALGRTTDAVVVLAVVVVNVIIGVVQEDGAAQAIAALDMLVPSRTAVLRDGEQTEVPAAVLVPGDVVSLRAGDGVPADMRVETASNLQLNEASLTGESLPAVKDAKRVAKKSPLGDRTSMLFSGTVVVAGSGQAVVVATGAETELGRMSTLLRETSAPETPLTQSIRKLSQRIAKTIALVGFLIFIIALRRNFPGLVAVRAALSFACAALPLELPAVFTIILAVAVRHMAARNVVTRTLPAIETLGCASVILSDKTGTLTRGEMTVRHFWSKDTIFDLTGAGLAPTGDLVQDHCPLSHKPRDILELSRGLVLASDASLKHRAGGVWLGVGDPIEVALLVAGEKVGVRAGPLRARWRRVDTIPFDSARGYMATLCEDSKGVRLAYVKGAPEVVTRYCDTGSDDRPLDTKRVAEVVDLLAALGMRVLAVASWQSGTPLDELDMNHFGPAKLLGLVGIMDPPRPEAIAAIASCHEAGIGVKMVTGDHPETARAVGAEIGLLGGSRDVLTGEDVKGLGHSALQRAALKVDIFARVEPSHKLALVKALQARGEVVAMTGDGVNDAPALKQADIGIAMGKGGTTTARQAADVVLLDDNFASIAAAVEEGRRCYDNLIKALLFLIPTHIGQSLVIVLGVLFFPVVKGVPLLPLVPIQVLWVTLVTGVTLAQPLAYEAAAPDIMRRQPRSRDEPILNLELALRSVLVGASITAGAVGLFLAEYFHFPAASPDPEAALRRAQTMVATTVILFQVIYLFECRSLHGRLRVRDWFSNSTVWMGVGLTMALQLAFAQVPVMNVIFHSAPLAPRDWALSTVVALSVVPVVALHKWLTPQTRRANFLPESSSTRR